MVLIGFSMLALVLWGNWLRRGDRLERSSGFLRLCMWSAPWGFIAVLAGWTTTEVGRQPWTVYGLLRTADSVSPSLTGGDVMLSFIGYVIVYAIVFPAGFLIMRRIVRQGPQQPATDAPVESGRPSSPIESLPDASSQGGLS